MTHRWDNRFMGVPSTHFHTPEKSLPPTQQGYLDNAVGGRQRLLKTHKGIRIVQTLAINLLTSIDPL